jgi:hypothetical protein
MNDSYFNSPEFKRTTGTMADTGIKIVFKWLGIAIAGFANFIKSLVTSAVGK